MVSGAMMGCWVGAGACGVSLFGAGRLRRVRGAVDSVMGCLRLRQVDMRVADERPAQRSLLSDQKVLDTPSF